jgi:aerobic carbon-monoxide dehydrogenase large subunit
VKGIGESGSIAAPPTMVHAVLDALAPLGVTEIDMPMTPLRIWNAIQQASTAALGQGERGVRGIMERV